MSASVTNPRLWIFVLSLLGVLVLVLLDVDRTSPGPLAAVHARIPELNGSRSCKHCHGGFRQSMTSACLDCHDPVAAQIDDRHGLHGSFADDTARNCVACHSEHHGADFAMVNLQSFVQAGVPDPNEFDHELIGFTMSGKHLELDCAECHEHARDKVLAEGSRRFAGLSQNCATCHEDPHEGRMKIACSDCHGQESFDRLDFADHDRHLALRGGHETLDCRACHGKETSHSLELLGSGGAFVKRDCMDCHESPHADTFLTGVSRLLGMSAAASCTGCHEPHHLTFRDERLTLTAEQHACSGFALDTPHDAPACNDCHRDSHSFLLRFPGRGADDCKACHEDPHGGQFDQGPGDDSLYAGNNCAACHQRHTFTPHDFTADKHALAGFLLDGSHADLECAACHRQPFDGGPRMFHGTPARCEQCHDDAHRGFFDARARVASFPPSPAGDCARCHRTTRFREVADEAFDHGAWTGFELTGSHAQASCDSCHERAAEPDDFGRTLGFVSDRFGTVRGCVSCHLDPHAGHFDRPGLPQEVDGARGCARCHQSTSFRTAADDFDHERWTGFPLEGAHAEQSCSKCHGNLRRPDEVGRTRLHARSGDCSACHQDPHDGQFRQGETNDCRRCHQSAVSFAKLSFNHNLDSRFPLDNAHAEVACSECHRVVHHEDRQFVRYRPLGRQCADCHGDNKTPLRRRKRGQR